MLGLGLKRTPRIKFLVTNATSEIIKFFAFNIRHRIVRALATLYEIKNFHFSSSTLATRDSRALYVRFHQESFSLVSMRDSRADVEHSSEGPGNGNSKVKLLSST